MEEGTEVPSSMPNFIGMEEGTEVPSSMPNFTRIAAGRKPSKSASE